jgi:NADH-quinone oxidoreductase subunit E
MTTKAKRLLTDYTNGVYTMPKMHYKLTSLTAHRSGVIGMNEEKEIEEKTREIFSRLGSKRENLIPILQQIQEAFGYLPSGAMVEVARFLKIPEIDVYSVVTFYNQFRLTPPGKHSIRVCMGTACHVKGGHITLEAWQRRLKIEPGETSSDREFDLDTVACVGCCAMAPVTVVDKKVEAKADPTRVDGILLSYQLQKEKEEKPS